MIKFPYKPTLFIGIGGSGCEILSQIKKCFEDEFGKGNVPDHIRFLAIDTDTFSYRKKTLKNLEGDLYEIAPRVSPKDYISENKSGCCDWYIKVRHGNYPKVGVGTGTDRAKGRLLLEMDRNDLQTRLHLVLREIEVARQKNSFRSQDIDVRMVMSLAGGSGSGIFIPVALMLSKIPDVNIYAYSILHGPFETLAGERTVINTYASILELDYIQNATFFAPVEICFAGMRHEITSPLFKEFYLVDNTDCLDRVIHKPQVLHKSLSLSMYLSSLDIVHRNLVYGLEAGTYNVLNKRGWVGSVCSCEVVYKGDVLANLHSHIVAEKTMSVFLQDSSGNYGEADAYFRSSNINRVSFYLSEIKARTERLKIRSTTPKDIRNEVMSYLQSASSVVERCKSVKYDFNEEFEAYIPEIGIYVNKVLEFLTELKDIYIKFADQIALQVDSCAFHRTKNHALLDEAIDDLERYNNRVFLFKNRVADLVKRIETLAYELACIQNELEINEYLLSIIEESIQQICRYEERCSDAKCGMNQLLITLQERIKDLIKECSENTPFSYNLSFCDLAQIDTNINDSVVIEFCGSSGLGYNCLTWDTDSLIDNILAYADAQPEIEKYRIKTLSQVIETMTKDQTDKMYDFIRDNVVSMLRLNRQGLQGTGSEQMLRDVIISTNGYDKARWASELKSWFWMLQLTPHWNESSSEGMRQKMLISLSEGWTIPYFVEVFASKSLRQQYDDMLKKGYNPHIDATLYEGMSLSGFSLQPSMAPALPHDVDLPCLETKQNDSQIQELDFEPETKKYDVFISSKSDDYVYAEQVYDFLVANGLSVFLACRELKMIGEAEYAESIDDALDETKHMIVVTSSVQHVKSKWVKYEWRTFENDRKSGYRDGNLLVIRLPEVEQQHMPPALRHKEFLLFDSYQKSILYYLK